MCVYLFLILYATKKTLTTTCFEIKNNVYLHLLEGTTTIKKAQDVNIFKVQNVMSHDNDKFEIITAINLVVFASTLRVMLYSFCSIRNLLDGISIRLEILHKPPLIVPKALNV